MGDREGERSGKRTGTVRDDGKRAGKCERSEKSGTLYDGKRTGNCDSVRDDGKRAGNCERRWEKSGNL
jgi:hypothetical protein